MVLASLFVTSLVITNLIAGKYFVINGLPLSCGVIVYPVTFLVTDIVSEVYGLHRARLLVMSGFVVSVSVTGLVWVAHRVPMAATSPVSAADFGQVFGLLPGIVFGSMVAYLTAQFMDVYLFEALRKLSGGRYLWLRNNGATLCSQLVDTVLVVTISLVLWPLYDGNAYTQPIGYGLWRQIVVSQYLFKGLLALLDTPFVYAGVYLTRHWIGNKPCA